MTKIEYTIKNEEKGYYGCFSKAGKYSAEILTNIRLKDNLLNPKDNRFKNKEAAINFLKRNGYHNIYGDDKKVNIIMENELNDSVIEEIEEEIDVFKKIEKKKGNNKKKGVNKNKKWSEFKCAKCSKEIECCLFMEFKKNGNINYYCQECALINNKNVFLVLNTINSDTKNNLEKILKEKDMLNGIRL